MTLQHVPPFDCQAVSQLYVPPVLAFAEGERVNWRFKRLHSHNDLARIAGSHRHLWRVQDTAKPYYDTACALRVPAGGQGVCRPQNRGIRDSLSVTTDSFTFLPVMAVYH